MAQPRHYGHPGSDCAADMEPGVSSQQQTSGQLDLVIDVTQACGSSGVTLQMVDRSTRRTLGIEGNSRPLPAKALSLELRWRNWCARPGELAAIDFELHGSGELLTVMSPPPCLDASQPSTLALQPTSS